MSLQPMSPGPDPGACPRCGEWRKAGMIHRCPAASSDPPDDTWKRAGDDTPPEIEKLRWDAKMLHGKPAGTVWLADAEAAVLACEERCDALRARQQGTLRRVLGEIGAVLRDETATNTTKVAQIAGIMANGPLDDAPGGPCEQAVEAARLDERERLSARAYENGWCPTCAATPAPASPDERLREAGEALAASIRELGRPIGDTTGGRWGRAKKALDAWVAALAAADREAPDEGSER